MSDQSGAGRRELQEVRRQSAYFLAYAFLFSVFVNFLLLTGPLFMLQVYDRVLGSRSVETLVALFVLVAGLYGLMALLDFARAQLLGRYGARFQSALDDRVFKATLTPPPRGQRDAPSGLTATADLEAIQTLYASSALTALLDAPFAPLFIAAIFIFDPFLGWLAVAGGGALIALTVINRLVTSRKLTEAQHAAAQISRFSENARQANEIIRSQGMLNAVSERRNLGRTKALALSMHASDWTGGFSSFSKAFRLFLQSAMLALGAYLVLQNRITPGAMIAASIMLGRALAPVEQTLARWPQIERARVGWKSLSAFLASRPGAETRTELPRPGADMSVTNVSLVTARGEKPILNAISFDLSPGEALGVIGRSGSGKTTLAKTLLGLVAPSAGQVRLGGALLGQYAPEALGRYIGYLPQDAMLINGTIAENIARMSLNPDSAAVVAAAKKAKVHDLITHLPAGYDTVVEDNTVQLSGGQRQRIALARALYGDPVILVLDEPNSALDMEGTEALNAVVRSMKEQGSSVIIMTHRPIAISECDRLLVLEKGQVSALGPRDEVMRSMLKNADNIQQTLAQRGKT